MLSLSPFVAVLAAREHPAWEHPGYHLRQLAWLPLRSPTASRRGCLSLLLISSRWGPPWGCAAPASLFPRGAALGPAGAAAGGAGPARRRPQEGEGRRRVAAAIMRAPPGLSRLLLAARGWGRLGAMSRYSTEQRGRPNSPDYRLYFSK